MNTELFERFKISFQPELMCQEAIAGLITLVPDKVDIVTQVLEEGVGIGNMTITLYEAVIASVGESGLQSLLDTTDTVGEVLRVKLHGIIDKGISTIMEIESGKLKL